MKHLTLAAMLIVTVLCILPGQRIGAQDVEIVGDTIPGGVLVADEVNVGPPPEAIQPPPFCNGGFEDGQDCWDNWGSLLMNVYWEHPYSGSRHLRVFGYDGVEWISQPIDLSQCSDVNGDFVWVRFANATKSGKDPAGGVQDVLEVSVYSMGWNSLALVASFSNLDDVGGFPYDDRPWRRIDGLLAAARPYGPMVYLTVAVSYTLSILPTTFDSDEFEVWCIPHLVPPSYRIYLPCVRS